jgi:four helix bundle protein
MENQFHDKLKKIMNEYAHLVYKVTKGFPKEEIYGITSQIRRASLSVILNYIEGFSRRKKLVMLNFFEISYGSLKESKYLLEFTLEENYLSKENYIKLEKLADEIGAMLWRTIKGLEDK